MTYKYCVAENWGKGFIDIDDAISFSPTGFPGNIWQIPANNKNANLWVYKVAGTFKTKDEAQQIINSIISQAQIDFDVETETLKTQEPYISLSEEEKNQNDVERINQRPTTINLPE
jgi:hypothetical protein